MHNIFQHIRDFVSGKDILFPCPSMGKGCPQGGKGVVLFLLLLFPLFSFAQTRVISGTVSDDMGPIMMANVVERMRTIVSSLLLRRI